MNISGLLLQWYVTHRRKLPWRETKDPYRIWVSEVILQQTRVEQGIGYYRRFIERYPDLPSLAEASLDEVLKSWQGLGYYTRARNLHQAAREMYHRHQGRFPREYRDLLALPGIGPYTASAIASFAFDRVVAVVDGNVARVLARLEAINTPINTTRGKKQLDQLAQALISSQDPATHNQAIIEFGALQCVPKNPYCPGCPLQEHCQAYQLKQVTSLPVKAPKRAKKNRYFYYIPVHYHDALLMDKRNDSDIWQGLYQFPLIETPERLEPERLTQTQNWKEMFDGVSPQITDISSPYKHVLTHQYIQARFIRVHLEALNPMLGQTYQLIPAEELHDLAVPRLIEKYLEHENYPKNP